MRNLLVQAADRSIIILVTALILVLELLSITTNELVYGILAFGAGAFYFGAVWATRAFTQKR